ncbi:MAG TPA: phage baseplate assembly protein V [Gammaproteobacteria bacterium]
MSRPRDVFEPAFSFRVAGEAAPASFIEALSGWRVSQQLSQPSVCVLRFHDPDPSGADALRLGAELELADGNGVRIFAGAVTSIRRERRADGLRVLTVRARDALEQLRRRQTMTVRRPDTLAGVVTTLVSGLGLEVAIAVDEDGPKLPLMIQWNTSDLDWMATLCAAYGRYFSLEGGTLRLMSLEGWSGPPIELGLDENLFEASIESDALSLRTEATACAWNPLNVETYSASALDLTLDVERDWETAPASLKEIGRDIVGGAGPQSEDVVSRVAQADLERAVKRAYRFEGLAEGDARLKPGARIALKGQRDGLEGEFALTRVEHRYAAESGYVCALSSEPPADPERRIGPAISVGVVSDTNDPARAGRVKVRLKAFKDAESDWLNVCSLGAGASKGFVLQPEEGDDVLVAFANDNPAQGVVIGGLFGAHPLHDDDVGQNRPRPCSLRTSGGQLLRLDDQQGAIELKSRGGVFDLDPDGVVLQSEADLRIAAPGRRITIVADRIDFRRG